MKKIFNLKFFTLVFAFILLAFNSNAQVDDDVPSSFASTLSKGNDLNLEQSLASPNGEYKLTMERNNNLVFYKNNQKIWESNTGYKTRNGLRFEQTGNLLMAGITGNTFTGSTGGASWVVKSGDLGGNLLKVEDNGNVLIYNGAKAVWSLKNPNGNNFDSPTGYLLK